MIKRIIKKIFNIKFSYEENEKLRKKLEYLEGDRQNLLDKINDLSSRENNYLIQLKKRGTPYKTYASYEEAIAECKTPNTYENEELVKAIIHKQSEFNRTGFKPFEVPDAIWAALCAINYTVKKTNHSTIRVLDHGGAAGTHYFFLKYFLNANINLKWCVVETAKMVEYAKKLTTNDLSFTTSLEEAETSLGGVDLFYSSGTLQCIPNPYDFLKQVVEKKWPFLFFNRTGFTRGNYDVTSIQKSLIRDNGLPGTLPPEVANKEVQYPVTYMQFNEFQKIIDSSYSSPWHCPVESGYHMVNDEPIFGNAMFYERKL